MPETRTFLIGPNFCRKYPRLLDLLTDSTISKAFFQEPSHTYLLDYTIIQKDNSAPYVADRIVRLLLELL